MTQRSPLISEEMFYLGSGTKLPHSAVLFGTVLTAVKVRTPAIRSFKKIGIEDLRRLLKLARTDRESFFRAHPDWAELYQHRVLGTALCQGAALHFIRPDH